MNYGYAGTKELNEALVSRFMVVDMPPLSAIRMGIVNKSFDVFEKEMLEDVIATRIPSSWTRAEIFEG